MSRIFAASQYETNYLPHKLGNWEVPDKSKQPQGHFSTTRTRKSLTKPIVGANGHLMPGMKKTGGKGAFNRPQDLQPYQIAVPRWPQNPTMSKGASATMGYKGIQTPYLPTSTVAIRTAPGGREDRELFQ